MGKETHDVAMSKGKEGGKRREGKGGGPEGAGSEMKFL